MNFAGLLFIMVAQYLSGKGLLRLLRVELKPLAVFCFSMMLGVVIISFAPCILQLLKMPIAATQVAVTIAIMAVIFSIPLLINFRKPVLYKITLPSLYELPFLLFVTILMILSVWRCFYYPPYARDMLSGPELIAEYAVREKTMINSVYTIDLQTSNNYFKSPFITCLQIIYKLWVTTFGQLWLSVLALSFIIWLYSLLKERIHALLAGMILIFFMGMPEVFAYTYVILYDYSNMIFFFAGYYFLAKFLQEDKRSDFVFSVALFGISTYIRTETLLLVLMAVPLPAYHLYKQHAGMKKMVIQLGMMVFVSAFFYYLCNNVFVKLFVPLPLSVAGMLNAHLADVTPFFDRLEDIFRRIIFTDWGIKLYGYYVVGFFGLLIIDLVISRKFAKEAKIMLYGIGVVIIGLALLGYVFPLVDLTNTTKRGLFKMMPLIALYMANSRLLQGISKSMTNWEQGVKKPAVKPAPARVAPTPKVVVKGKGRK